MQGFGGQQNDAPTAYLGNLPKGAAQMDFDQLFAGLKLETVRLIRDRETDEEKGYGYAVFKDEESLQKALELKDPVILGQRIKIDMKRQSNRNRQQGGPGGQRGGGFAGGDRGGRQDFGGMFNRRDNRQGGGFDDQGRQGDRPERQNRPIPDQPPFTAYVGNLPEEAVQSDLETMFQGLDLIKVHLVMDRETPGRHRGYGYADFNSREALVRALSLDGAQWMNKALKVNVHERRQGGFENRGAGGGSAGGFQQQNGGGGRFDQQQGGGGRFSRDAFAGGDRRGPRPAGERNFRPVEEPAPIEDGKERPKLVLQKKSEGGSTAAKSATAAAPSSSSKPSPFGNARPVDTASKLQQMEEQKKAADAAKKAADDAKAAAEGAKASDDSKAAAGEEK